jgi:hypothetical protein
MRANRNRQALSLLPLLLLAGWLAAMPRNGGGHGSASSTATPAADAAASVAAFKQMLIVIRNPRCMNCHSTGDYPRQGDDGHRHTMNVHRGTSGLGLTAEKCSTCHQDHNLEAPHLPPGAPGWRLPSASTPMIWEGLTDRGICEQLKDPARNGHRKVEELVEHFSQDKLVGWGWNPGPGRSPVPMPREELAANVKKWVANGAACPAE